MILKGIRLTLVIALYVAFGGLLVWALWRCLASLQGMFRPEGEGFWGASFVMAALFTGMLWFSLSGLHALRKHWGLARVRQSGDVEPRALDKHPIPDEPVAWPLAWARGVFLVLLYLTSGTVLVIGMIGTMGVFLGDDVRVSAGARQGILGLALMAAAWFAFFGLHALRARWGIEFKRATYTRRYSTTDLLG